MINELYNELKFLIKNSIYPVVTLYGAAFPTMCFFMGKAQLPDEPTWLLIVLIMVAQIALYCIKWYLTKMGKGNDVPSPVERFTSVSNDGEVTVDVDRMQEMLLYVADVEDYLERKGLLANKANKKQTL